MMTLKSAIVFAVAMPSASGKILTKVHSKKAPAQSLKESGDKAANGNVDIEPVLTIRSSLLSSRLEDISLVTADEIKAKADKVKKNSEKQAAEMNRLLKENKMVNAKADKVKKNSEKQAAEMDRVLKENKMLIAKLNDQANYSYGTKDGQKPDGFAKTVNDLMNKEMKDLENNEKTGQNGKTGQKGKKGKKGKKTIKNKVKIINKPIRKYKNIKSRINAGSKTIKKGGKRATKKIINKPIRDYKNVKAKIDDGSKTIKKGGKRTQTTAEKIANLEKNVNILIPATC